MAASKAGGLDAVLALMTDDVVFMVPGAEPFGKQAFDQASQQMEGTSEIVELRVLGDGAWIRNRLHITVTPPGGAPVPRSGYTLTILRKQAVGCWPETPPLNRLATRRTQSF